MTRIHTISIVLLSRNIYATKGNPRAPEALPGAFPWELTKGKGEDEIFSGMGAGGQAGCADREPAVADLRALADLDEEVASHSSPWLGDRLRRAEWIAGQLVEAIAGRRAGDDR